MLRVKWADDGLEKPSNSFQQMDKFEAVEIRGRS